MFRSKNKSSNPIDEAFKLALEIRELRKIPARKQTEAIHGSAAKQVVSAKSDLKQNKIVVEKEKRIMGILAANPDKKPEFFSRLAVFDNPMLSLLRERNMRKELATSLNTNYQLCKLLHRELNTIFENSIDTEGNNVDIEAYVLNQFIFSLAEEQPDNKHEYQDLVVANSRIEANKKNSSAHFIALKNLVAYEEKMLAILADTASYLTVLQAEYASYIESKKNNETMATRILSGRNNIKKYSQAMSSLQKNIIKLIKSIEKSLSRNMPRLDEMQQAQSKLADTRSPGHTTNTNKRS